MFRKVSSAMSSASDRYLLILSITRLNILTRERLLSRLMVNIPVMRAICLRSALRIPEEALSRKIRRDFLMHSAELMLRRMEISKAPGLDLLSLRILWIQ